MVDHTEEGDSIQAVVDEVEGEPGAALDIDLDKTRPKHPVRFTLESLDSDVLEEVDEPLGVFWLSKSAAKKLAAVLNRRVRELEKS